MHTFVFRAALASVADTSYPGTADFLAGAALAVLFCGVLVALLWRTLGRRLRRYQLAAMRMRALRQDLDDLVARLKAALSMPDALDLSGAEASRPPAIESVNRIIEQHIPAEHVPAHRVFDRYRCLPRQQALLDALTCLRQADETFGEAARRLDRLVTGFIGDHNAPRRIDPLHDQIERAYFFGLVHGQAESDLANRVGVPPEIIERARTRARAIEADAEIAALVPPYLAARVRLSAAGRSLLDK